MGYTIEEARTKLSKIILDPNEDRVVESELTDTLRGAVMAVLKHYATEGGMLLAKIADITTDANGEYDWTADPPLHVHAVARVDDEDLNYTPLQPVQVHQVTRLHRKEVDLRLHYTPYPEMTWDDDADVLLAGADASTTHLHSDEALENWIIYWAAVELHAPEDRDLMPLVKQRDRYMRACLRHNDVMGGFAMDAQPQLDHRVRLWSYRPDTQVLFLAEKGGYYR